MKLTKTDQLILNSYATLLDGLGDYLGEGYEFVLHNLENYEHSIIKIVNGYHSSRVVGSPITDLALEMMKRIGESTDETHRFVTYFNKNKNGAKTKSSTLPIFGESNRIIGLICINFYMDTPFSKIVENLVDHNAKDEKEVFADNIDDLISGIFTSAREEVYSNEAIPSVNRNREILAILYKKGVFNIKDAVVRVAKKLSISKNTVYLHIRSFEASEE
ncbi:MAG: PAS domain-containing protein [Christensenellaceae bacterium]|jgi:predicted transcriptional regulator YheO|nr:PAS domain-containing protein [Christensenellaceae bacterium]